MNWVVEELAEAFQVARSTALEYARPSHKIVRQKRNLAETAPNNDRTDIPRKRTRSSGRINARSYEPVECDAPDEDKADNDSDLEDGFVQCPVCDLRVRLDTINPHLDRCMGKARENTSSLGDSALDSGATKQQRPTSKPRTISERLPEVSYSLIKDNALRKRMADLGISTLGNRTQLEQRHREWLNLWNANCDSTKPRPRTELLQDLQIWERAQGMRSSSRYSLDIGSPIMSKDFDAAAWASNHGQSFQQLIADARRRRPGKDSVNATSGSSVNAFGAGMNATQLEAEVSEVFGTPSPSAQVTLDTSDKFREDGSHTDGPHVERPEYEREASG
ncbi:MAG: E3 ubiquitin-protein ligase rad18 [Claussenomyces sp. TS43310]|nr:MAG: E3 ubiquitin-protein ligase rad18 [Claussenomyces sp. TS43310]